jgi:hypothetical protein
MNGCATLDPVLGYVPAIPEPFWVRRWLFWSRPSCYPCRLKFKTRAEYDAHYALTHIEAL